MIYKGSYLNNYECLKNIFLGGVRMKKALIAVSLLLVLYGGSIILAMNVPVVEKYTFCKGSDAICQQPGSQGAKCGSEEGCTCTYYFLVGTYCTRQIPSK